ncbi:hypothetical protein EDD86DRAFT_249129 [Gorgonomyces haynaldii]|nr:hypothetical protein EDD86DRAFT_249129 [Gorgonomyces haynaldii]
MLLQLLFDAYSAQTIADILQDPRTNTTSLWSYLNAFNLTAQFSAPGNLTLFAPSDADHTLNSRWEVPTTATKLYLTSKLGRPIAVDAPGNASIPVTVTGGIAHSGKIIATYRTTNGIIHVTDTILVPPFFVPIDTAISDLLVQVAKAGFSLIVSTLSVIADNHIVTGLRTAADLAQLQGAGGNLVSVLPRETLILGADADGLTIKGQTTADIRPAHVIVPDILVTQGIMHIIDSVLVPSNAVLVTSLVQKGPTIPH